MKPYLYRLKELSELEDGWLDGEGKNISPQVLDLAEKILKQLIVDLNVPTPHLYPTEEGGISAEWDNSQGFLGLF